MVLGSRRNLVLTGAVLLCGCFSPDDPPSLDSDGGSTGSTGAQETITSATEASATEASATEASATEASATEASATDASATDPSTTDPTQTGSESGDTGTTGPSPQCGDGASVASELCLDVPPNTLSAPQMPVDVALGDVSSNGLLDIVVAGRGDVDGSDIVVVLEADGVGGFVSGSSETTPSPTSRLRLGDLDDDGDLDIVVHAGDVVWLRNQGSFLSDALVADNFGGDWSVSDTFIADLDEDGILDVAYTEGYGRRWVQGVLNNGNWTAGAGQSFPGPGEGASGMVAGALSFDGDDDIDVIAFNQYYSSALLLPNGGDGSFSTGPDVPLCPADIDGVRYGELADFNDDGMTDVVVTCMDGDGAVSLGVEDGFAPPVALPLAGAFKTTVADVDGDGDQDVLMCSTTLDRAVMYINDGTGAFDISDIQFMAPGPVHGLAAGDLNDDGAMDVVILSAPEGPGRVDVYTADP